MKLLNGESRNWQRCEYQLYPVDGRGLYRMKMLPVMILAKYHSSARSAVSERPNSSTRLVSQWPNSTARLVSQWPNSTARLVSQWPNSTARLVSQCPNSSTRLVFPNVPSRACDSLSNVPIIARTIASSKSVYSAFFYNNYFFLSQYAFHVYVY